jgi:hypothetical protein
MLATEDQAKGKACPFMPLINPIFAIESSGNIKNVGGGESGCCIASACMMWRWLGPDEEGGVRAVGTNTSSDRMIDVHVAGEPGPRVGFCGLAGSAYLWR